MMVIPQAAPLNLNSMCYNHFMMIVMTMMMILMILMTMAMMVIRRIFIWWQDGWLCWCRWRWWWWYGGGIVNNDDDEEEEEDEEEHLMTIPICGRNMAKRTQMTMVVALIPKMCHTPLIRYCDNHLYPGSNERGKKLFLHSNISVSPGQTLL